MVDTLNYYYWVSFFKKLSGPALVVSCDCRLRSDVGTLFRLGIV